MLEREERVSKDRIRSREDKENDCRESNRTWEDKGYQQEEQEESEVERVRNRMSFP